MDPFPVPPDVTVHHVWSLDTIQEELDVTVKLVVPAGDVTFWFGGTTESVGEVPAWETVTTTGVSPVTVTVILATREETPRFAVKVAVRVELPVPDAGTVHHVWSLTTVQLALEVTVKLVVPAVAVTFWFGGTTARVRGTPACVTVTTSGVRPVTVTVILATRAVVRVSCV